MQLNFLTHPALRTLATRLVASLIALGFAACGSEVERFLDAQNAGDGLAHEDVLAEVAGADGQAVPDGDADSIDDADVLGSDLDDGDADAADQEATDGADGELEDVAAPQDAEDIVDISDVTPLDDALSDAETVDSQDDLDVIDVIDVSGLGPFDDLASFRDGELRAALLARISNHTILGYEGVGTARQVIFAVVDAHDGRLECIYTGRTVAAENPAAAPLGSEPGPSIDTTPNADCRWPDGSVVIGGCVFNAEHSWPRSLGADNAPASSDLHHIFPTYDNANNQRGSYQFGETVCAGSACPWSEAESELGDRADGQKVFQVRQRFRGDIARAQFYFAVRYARAIDTTVESTLRAWHVQDPVDGVERARNDAIDTFQHNRNPFVDRPDFVDLLSDF